MSVTGTELVKLRPLSSAQSSIWFAQMLDPHSPIYNIGEYLEILGPIDPQLFETALRQVVAECDALRLRVVETDEGPRQYIDADPDWSMPFFDVSGEADPCAVAERWMHEDMARVVDLTRGPLFGYALFRAATNRFFWYARCTDHPTRPVVDALRAFGAAHEASLAQVVTAVSALYLHRLTRCVDLILGMPVRLAAGDRRNYSLGR